MKILVIHTTYKLRGGEDSVVANEIALLRSIGEEVELLEFSNSKETVLKVLQMPFNYAAYRETKKKIAAFQPDVVHVHNLHFGASASVVYAIKKNNIPCVITLHNYRLLCPSATLFYHGDLFLDSVNKLFSIRAVLKGVYLNSTLMTFWVSCSMLLHQLLGTWKIVDKYIVLGQQTKAIFNTSKLRVITERMIVKPNFCYSKSEPVKYKRDYYLYLGRVSHEKGISILLHAFAENGLPLKIAGTGPMDEEVKEYSTRYSNIEYLGSVNPQNAGELIAGAIALIFPSLWYETFGMVIIEAFAAGTPVIACNIGEPKYMIKNHVNGLQFDAGSIGDLQEKIAYYDHLSDMEKMTYQNNALSSYRDKYTPDKNSAQLLAVYSQAIVHSEN